MPAMARIVLIGVEQATAGKIRRALAVERHHIEHQPPDLLVRDLQNVEIVFAGGEPVHYLSLLRRIRESQPTLPFVVVARIAETKEWLDALEAGATDYCSAPIERQQLHWLMQSALAGPRFAAT
jgi:DNA-binding NarL/FixJ family response regulator